MSDEQKKESPMPKEGEDKTKENEVNKDLKSLEAQKEHFRSKFEKTEAERQILENELNKLEAELAAKNSTPPETNSTQKNDYEVSEIKQRIQKIEFAQKHPEIDAGDFDDIFKLAEVNNKSLDETLELPMIKAYLKEKDEKKRIDEAIPTDNRSSILGAEKPIAEMTRDEHKALWNKLTGQ